MPILQTIAWIAGVTAAIGLWPTVLAAALVAAAAYVIANWYEVDAAIRAGLQGLQGLARDLVAWVASIIPDWLKDAWDWLRGGGATTGSGMRTEIGAGAGPAGSVPLDTRPALPPGAGIYAPRSVTVENINVQPSPGMNEQDLAQRTADTIRYLESIEDSAGEPIHDGVDYAD